MAEEINDNPHNIEDRKLENSALTVLLLGLPFMMFGAGYLYIFQGTAALKTFQLPATIAVGFALLCLAVGLTLALVDAVRNNLRATPAKR